MDKSFLVSVLNFDNLSSYKDYKNSILSNLTLWFQRFITNKIYTWNTKRSYKLLRKIDVIQNTLKEGEKEKG